MKELFEEFEVNREPRWPILSKLVGASVGVHFLIVIAIIFVPSVRSALTLATTLSGARYVDKDYVKTQIEDRAVMLSLQGGKFTYPPGYFDAINGVTYQPIPVPSPTPPLATIISQFKPEKQKAAKVGRSALDAEAGPSPSPSPGASPEQAAGTNAADILAGAKDAASANKALDQVAAESNVERPDEGLINKKPLKDWLASADKLRTEGKIDLTKTVELVISADRNPDGKLQNVEVQQKNGDPQLIQVAKDLASALSDSKVLYFLKDTKKLQISIKLDDTSVTAHVETDMGTEARAVNNAKAYGLFLSLGQMVKDGKNEATIYKAAKVESKGTQVFVNFAMPRDIATDILKQYRAEAVPSPSPSPTPSG